MAGRKNKERKISKRRMTVYRVIVCVFFVGVIAMAAALVVHVNQEKQRAILEAQEEERKKEEYTVLYAQAEQLVEEEQYEDALEILENIDEDFDGMDTATLLGICEAHVEYDAGDLVSAHTILSGLNFYAYNVTINRGFYAFRQQVNNEYKSYRTKQQKEYQSTLVPYVGMSESRIGETSLGTPVVAGHNNYVKDGQILDATIYRFKKNGVTIFTARCAEGVVIDVQDTRDRLSSSSSGSSSGSSSSGSSSSSSDRYNASSYNNAEEFYMDHWDDFIDYEEAEKYWKANK